MDIVCISDMHGYLPEDVPGGDVLVIAGDICPASDHAVSRQIKWLNNDFNAWVKELPFEHIVMVAGNHDWAFQKAAQRIYITKVTWLQETSTIINDVVFYGYANTPRFCNWAFNEKRRRLKQIAGGIPPGTNVLVTHGPPLGTMDLVCDGDRRERVGCEALADRIKELNELKLHVFGHIHSGHGIKHDDQKGMTYVNASHVNEQYLPVYSTQVITI
jgi:Icc-related predicted phosphoesterase